MLTAKEHMQRRNGGWGSGGMWVCINVEIFDRSPRKVSLLISERSKGFLEESFPETRDENNKWKRSEMS